MSFELKKYGRSLMIRVLVATFLLLIMIVTIKIKLFNNVIKSNFNKQLNIINPVTKVYNIFSNEKNSIGDKAVNHNNVYDIVTYDGKINHIVNNDFNGVVNITDGLIIRIDKKENNLFDVYVQNKDSFIYIYKNLQSIDFGIYSYLSSQTIIGASQYDMTSNNYKFDLEILKEGVNYSLYEFTES